MRTMRVVEKLMRKYPPADASKQNKRQNFLPTSSLHWPCKNTNNQEINTKWAKSTDPEKSTN
jgi:hypothetical protein